MALAPSLLLLRSLQLAQTRQLVAAPLQERGQVPHGLFGAPSGSFDRSSLSTSRWKAYHSKETPKTVTDE